MAERPGRHVVRSAAGEEGTYTNENGEQIYFRGFRSKTGAKTYIRRHGGELCYAVDRTDYKKSAGAYMKAVLLGGLNGAEFPCCVQWKE